MKNKVLLLCILFILFTCNSVYALTNDLYIDLLGLVEIEDSEVLQNFNIVYNGGRASELNNLSSQLKDLPDAKNVISFYSYNRNTKHWDNNVVYSDNDIYLYGYYNDTIISPTYKDIQFKLMTKNSTISGRVYRNTYPTNAVPGSFSNNFTNVPTFPLSVYNEN